MKNPCHIYFFLLISSPKLYSYNVIRKDPFATLAETLRSQQGAACDGDSLKLECPAGTKISIQLVLYGRSSPSATVCPPTSMQPRIYTGNEGLSCNIREALRTVEELCQSKQSCSIITSTTSFGVSAYDPCPGVRKYVEVAYKCRPTTFSSRMVCGGESLSLTCNEHNENIAIFSSTFKSAGSGPLYCPLRTEYIKEALDYSKDEAGRDMKKCERADVTKSILKFCHGEKTCNIKADPLVLNAPSCHLQHVLLKVTYACMTGLNFLPKFIKQPMTIEKTSVIIPMIEENISEIINSNKYTTVKPVNKLDILKIKEIEKIIISEELNYEREKNKSSSDNLNLIHRITFGLIQNFQIVKSNGWKLMLILTLSTGLGVSGFLVLIIIRLCRLYRAKVETPHNSPSHLDLDTAMLDYEINTQLHTPLPEPKIMQISDELPTKFSTLTRNRTKPVTKMAPLENYMGEPPKDTVIRYSTIGRNKSNVKKSPISSDLDRDFQDPRSFNTSYENNQLYY